MDDGFYSDDVRLIAKLIEDEWSMYEPPVINFEPESFMVNSRIGSIYIYHTSYRFEPSSVSYATMRKTSSIGIRISNRFREHHLDWCNEVMRILLANRRAGASNLNGYTYLTVDKFTPLNTLSGWYTTTVDITLTGYAAPIQSPGFGERINKEIECNRYSEEY